MSRHWITGTIAAALAVSGLSAGATQTPQPAFDQSAAIAELERQIAGREEQPATEVFMNITQYKGVTAGRLLRIMDYGFSRGLGVTCTHCHVAGEWDRDDKATKQIARDMSGMVATINGELLKKVPNLRSTNPAVNCTTCHRGQIRPALQLPQTPVAPR
ncbi:MAG TPA: photosynthetic reaction center cytochrome c subunit family protein [Vicinamibacterales bacterium]|nr:photosynthetic reaction center cytochrome c subunit family protein [Vicinamibacterales bacterium]